MQKKKYGIKDIEAALQLSLDTEVEGTFLEYLKDGVSKTESAVGCLTQTEEGLECELSSLKAEMELGQRIKQLLLIEVKSLLSHKDFMEQVYYSPVNRIPKIRHGLSS